jgi:hypothetical protein
VPVTDGYEAFRAGFSRSRRGNLWRRYGDRTVTVFGRAGRTRWCVSSDGNQPPFSP